MHTEFKWKFRDFLPPKEYHFCANMYAYYNYFWPENYVYCSKYEFTYSYIKLLQQQFCFIWHRFRYNQQYIQTLIFTIFFKNKYLTSAHAWWQFNWVLLVIFFKSLKFFSCLSTDKFYSNTEFWFCLPRIKKAHLWMLW